MKSLNSEKKIGIETFITSFNGIGGKLRTIPEDFYVSEISKYPPINNKGKYVIGDVTVNNWETNHLVSEISKKLHISRKRIQFAGTKDKRAVSKRLMSFYNISCEELKNIRIKDVEIDNIYRTNKPVKIGSLLGNRFEIKIRNIKLKSEKLDNDLIYFLKRNTGFPNFFGIQRFGIIRPITHIVGKNIVNCNYKNAVMTYIANPIKEENENEYNLRSNLEKTLDFSEALKLYPKHLRYEKAILNVLVNNSDDYITALKELPNNLLTMFIYAYQSYLFNKILSLRIKNKLPLNSAIIGDIILPIRNNVYEKEINVTNSNISKVNKQISKGKAFVSALLLGSDSKFSNGEMGEIEHKIINEEKIDPRDFIIPDIPHLSSSGSRRAIYAFARNLDFKIIQDNINKGKHMINLNFELNKGSYATSFLREIMKTNVIQNY